MPSLRKTKALQERLNKLCPWGTQTNGKRPRPDLTDVEPPLFVRGKGATLWDADGNTYVDLGCSLGPIILGYCDEEVDGAVRRQMKKGVVFSMASDTELEAAETLLSILPDFGWVRFLKTGGDACSAACRVARTVTGRDLILSEGYHGWHDVFSSAEPGNGVPQAVRQVSQFVSTESAQAVDDTIVPSLDQAAAVIVSPEQGRGEIYRDLSEKCRGAGALLIFDEVVTGCRVALGGVQELESVRCDLVVMAKAIANGYPVSALAGREEHRSAFDRTLITLTHGGEALSLAALVATVRRLKREKVLARIAERGRRLTTEANRLFEDAGLPLTTTGHPNLTHLAIQGDDNEGLRILSVLSRQLLMHGVFERGGWLMYDALGNSEVDKVLSALASAINSMRV